MLTHLHSQNPLQATAIYFAVAEMEKTVQKKMKYPTQSHRAQALEAGRKPGSQISASCFYCQNLLSPTQLGTNCIGDTASSKQRCHTTLRAKQNIYR